MNTLIKFLAFLLFGNKRDSARCTGFKHNAFKQARPGVLTHQITKYDNSTRKP
jgi:hypothetical protein